MHGRVSIPLMTCHGGGSPPVARVHEEQRLRPRRGPSGGEGGPLGHQGVVKLGDGIDFEEAQIQTFLPLPDPSVSAEHRHLTLSRLGFLRWDSVSCCSGL
ncbi:hypothetical protein GCM10007172_10640 [Sinomonas atrocyanea]|nr:hypothetical protein GCM10007172_10640 [Sinomonas atrocyanea]